jgi:hypothetical protein
VPGAGLPWTEPAWRRKAEAWIEEHASVTGELDQFHIRWWSTVIRVPTPEGDLYFKATGDAQRFEAALTAKLAARMPDRVPEVIAIDPGRGSQLRALLREGPAGLTAVELELVETAVPEVKALCRELADYGVHETVQHDDLHDGQVFLRDGRYLFFDWGDSCVSHPFHTLTVTLRGAAFKLDLEPGGPELERLRAAYLEPFGDLADAAEIAYRTGTIARALAWHRYVSAAGVNAQPEDQSAAAYGLRLFLENGPIGTWREPETSHRP